MNLLTEKECNEALDWLYSLSVSCREEVHEHRSSFLGEKYNLIKQLINEHFSNPPLKFEEIESGKPIWDNKNKEWLLVNNALTLIYSSKLEVKDNVKLIKVGYKGRKNHYNVEQCEIDFEENRFYRKQVEE